MLCPAGTVLGISYAPGQREVCISLSYINSHVNGSFSFTGMLVFLNSLRDWIAPFQFSRNEAQRLKQALCSL